MGTSFWMILGLMWGAIGLGVIRLWRDRANIRARWPDQTTQVTVGVTIASVLVAVLLTAFSVGYGHGKARALEDNLADERARSSQARLPDGHTASG